MNPTGCLNILSIIAAIVTALSQRLSVSSQNAISTNGQLSRAWNQEVESCPNTHALDFFTAGRPSAQKQEQRQCSRPGNMRGNSSRRRASYSLRCRLVERHFRSYHARHSWHCRNSQTNSGVMVLPSLLVVVTVAKVAEIIVMPWLLNSNSALGVQAPAGKARIYKSKKKIASAGGLEPPTFRSQS